MQDLVNLFANTGSTIACLVACMWYIYTKDKRFAEQLEAKDAQISRLNELHAEENKSNQEVLNGVRVALTELTTFLRTTWEDKHNG